MIYFAYNFIRDHVTIYNYYYLLLLWERKRHWSTNNTRMENNEFKKLCIKICTCYYFNDIIRLEDFDFDNILIDEKSHKNILIYDISYKTLVSPKPITRYLVLLDPEKFRYLINLKSGNTYIFSPYFAKIKVDSYDSLPIEKILTLHNVIILIKSVLNKDKNHYYYKIFLEKCLY